MLLKTAGPPRVQEVFQNCEFKRLLWYNKALTDAVSFFKDGQVWESDLSTCSNRTGLGQ